MTVDRTKIGIIAVSASLALLTGACGSSSKTDSGSGAKGGGVKVALIGDQRFGDDGPMDDMAAGLEKCAEKHGYETKRFESIESAAHESDVRAVAADGYDLIFTTFPDMSPATSTVAMDYPDTSFGAIYQFINVDGAQVPNVWDTEYRGDSTYYTAGAVAATLSKTGKLGFVAGDQDPTITAAVNGYIQGAKSVDPSVTVESAVAGSYEDAARGKDIAKALLSRDVDVITTAAAKTQLGVIDAVKGTDALVIGDVADNQSRAPENFLSYIGSSFGQNVVLGCDNFADGKFEGGTHSFIDMTNEGYFFPTDVLTTWGENSGRTEEAAEAVKVAEKIIAGVNDGSITVDHIVDWPKS